MSTNRHNVRRGNVADKRTSRKSRAAVISRADKHAYSRADRVAILATVSTVPA